MPPYVHARIKEIRKMKIFMWKISTSRKRFARTIF